MKKPKLLFLGGTQFIGRNIVHKLMAIDEYEITLFNRQQTGNDLFPNIAKIKGDRTTDDIQQIANENWDYVIDCSCYHPDDLENTLANLKPNIKRYIFISTSSVYDNEALQTTLRNEDSPVLSCSIKQRENKEKKVFYGNKKSECERILKASNLNSIILRPTLVFGTYDYTDRFYYWLYQVKTNDTLLLPDNGNRKFSLIYVHDLVKMTILSLTTEVSGQAQNTDNQTFNIISFPQTSIREIVETAQDLLNRKNTIINATPEFLHENKVNQWTTMPLWIDHDFFTYSNERLKSEFPIQLTDFETATAETIAYYESLNWHQPTYGMNEAKRQELLSKL